MGGVKPPHDRCVSSVDSVLYRFTGFRVGLDLILVAAGVSASCFIRPSITAQSLLVELLVEEPCHGALLARKDDCLEVALWVF